MSNSVATAIFCVRSGDKAANGDVGRSVVAVAQGAKFVDRTAKGNGTAAKVAQAVQKTSEELSKSDKFFNGLTKTVDFAKNHVNPLIVASSGLKVALADKKERKNTIISESGNLAGMFIGEGWMNKNLTKVIDKLPISKKWKPVVEGVTFVAGSITSSTIGQKIGQKAAKYWDVPLSKSAREAKTADPAAQKGYKPLDLKA